MAGCTGTTLGIKWLSKTGPTVKWLKQLRPIVFDASPRLPRCTSSLMTANLEQSQRNISTTTPCFVKEIKTTEKGNQIIIEGIHVPSLREKYLAKIPAHLKCGECPLCKLGLLVRHTDVLIIAQFINSKGKQLPRNVTGLCAQQHRRMGYLLVMAEKSGLIERDVERIVMHNQKVLYAPEEWEEPTAFNKYYDETVIDEFMYGRRKRH